MSMYGGSTIGFWLVRGYSLLGAKLQGISRKVAAKQERTDGLGDSWEEYTPTGMKVSTLTQEGAFFDTGTNLLHEAMKTAPTTATAVACLAHEGNTIGKHFFGWGGAIHTGYEVLGKLGGLTKADVTYAISGEADEGIILQSLAAKTSDGNTEGAENIDYTTDVAQRVIPITSNTQANPTVITTPVPHGLTTNDKVLIAGNSGSSPTINGERVATVISTTTFSVPVNTSAGTGGTGGTFVKADSTGGGAGFQQVTAMSGFTGYVGKVRHSTDDSTYSTLVTFANVTSAPSAERVVVSGTVNRYLAADWDVTGSGSVTLFIGFARR